LDKKNYKIIFGVGMMALGIVLEMLNVGVEYLGFPSVGSWLIYVGVLSIILSIVQSLRKKERKVDERMVHLANKANRITFLAVILVSFAIMVIDGIVSIDIPYSLFMSYFICGITFFHLAVYRIFLRKY
jgi:uncharacterized membrane protein